MSTTADAVSASSSPGSANNDLALLHSVHRRDRHALAALYDSYIVVVYKTARCIVAEQSQAAEVVQQVFAELWRTPPAAHASVDLAAWLARATRRHALALLRPGLAARLHARQEAVYEHATTRASVPSRERICQILDHLQPLSRQAIDLAYYGGLTVAEISQQLAVSHKAVRAAVRQGLLRLRDDLAGGTLAAPYQSDIQMLLERLVMNTDPRATTSE
ncbi:MAG: sigma-70 family RNA polymerase sigma factor [Roseiflexaceae bacterium]|nr:sigma-70 family RNA polymerase sigma factor [Roseiflexaceae bacterium]